jgi:thioredoxin-related protein
MNLINNLRISTQVILIVLSSISVMAQGVSFKKINLAEALVLAKKENKNILIDFYTDWCGPYKWMDKNVFTDDSLAAIIDKNYIFVKADGDDKDLDINKKFKIRSFPTFLFLSNDGEILYKFLGKRTKEEFVSESKKALNPEYQISTFQRKYSSGIRDTTLRLQV